MNFFLVINFQLGIFLVLLFTLPPSRDMESYLIGGAEECNSCESGWTMYIASPMDADDAGDDSGADDHDSGNDVDGRGAAAADDSDDSMASDASSGPSHREQLCVVGDEIDHSENEDEIDKDEDEDEGDGGGGECSGYSYKRSYKRMDEDRGRIEGKKENPVHRGRKTDIVCNSSKVRNTKSKRKGN